MRLSPASLLITLLLALGCPSVAWANSQTFIATADSYVNAGSPISNYGSNTRLWVQTGPPVQRTYLRFDVELPAGATITGATLRLYAGSGSTSIGYQAYAVADTTWSEQKINYNNAPAFGALLGTSGGWLAKGYKRIRLPAGYIHTALNSVGAGRSASSPVDFWSREAGTNRPQLVVSYNTTSTDTTPPSAPANLTAGAGDQQVSLSWSASRDNVGVDHYQVFRNGTQITTTSNTSYTDSVLTNGTAYTYMVKAVDAAGNVSAASNTATATPQPAPTATAPPLRYVYDTDSASAPYGFNLMDVSSKAAADATPSGTKGLIWIGNYDNSTCQFAVTDAQVQSDLAGAAGDAKIAGYFIADEPDPAACRNAPQQLAARSQLVHKTDADPSHFTFMVMDSNSGSASLSQVPVWKGVTDYVGLDPYPCYQNRPCNFAWIDQIISAANAAGLNYWGVVQAFNDSTWRWPTADELTHMINQWAASSWKGFAVFAWTWDGFNLSDHPDLLSVLQSFNATAVGASSPPPDTTAPSTPTGLAATAGNAQVALKWNASTDPDDAVASYNVYRNGVKVASPTTTSYTQTGLTNGTTYSYQVSAVDTHGNESALSSSVTATPQAPAPGSPPHIMVILMENHGAGAIIGNSSAPFQNSLASNYITLTNWTGVDHPSAPNYVALVTAQDNGKAGVGDCSPAIGSSCDWPGDNLGNQLFAANVPAAWYAEDLNGNGCSIANSESGNNDVNHEPWAYMDAWQASSGACAQAGLTTTSPGDAQVISALNSSSPPDFVWVTPNLTDDTHNGTIAQGDTYLKNLVTAVRGTSWYASGGTIVVTYDEDEGESNPTGYCTNPVIIPAVGNHCIATFVVSAKAANVGTVATPGDHYGMVRSLEECYGLPLLNNAATLNGSGQALYGDIKSRLCG